MVKPSPLVVREKGKRSLFLGHPPRRSWTSRKAYWAGYEDYVLLVRPTRTRDRDYMQGWTDARLEGEEQD